MRCVAGRELLRPLGACHWGAWIRPVTTHDEGALRSVERRLANNSDPIPLDVIEIPLAGPENNPLQPENWIVIPQQPWEKVGAQPLSELVSLVEQPPGLWLDPNQKNDRASKAFLQKLPELQSLYLIRPTWFRFSIRTKTWEGVAKKQQRALFEYRGRRYDLSLTDPLIGRKYFPDFPKTAEGTIAPQLPVVLCVSLTQEFKGLGYFFKVVATVLEVAA